MYLYTSPCIPFVCVGTRSTWRAGKTKKIIIISGDCANLERRDESHLMLQAFQVPRDVDWWVYRKTHSKWYRGEEYRSLCVHASHPGMPIVIIGIATVVDVVVVLATVLPSNRRATDGTPANNMAKDYLMRTFRFTLLLNWICYNRKNTPLSHPRHTRWWWCGMRRQNDREKRTKERRKLYIISSTVTYFSSFLLLSSGYAWASSQYNAKATRLHFHAYYFILYAFGKRWRWKEYDKLQ